MVPSQSIKISISILKFYAAFSGYQLKLFVYLLTIFSELLNCKLQLCFRAAGNTLELVVGCAKTMDLLLNLEIEITDEILEGWPSSNYYNIPDFSNYENFFEDVAAADVDSEVTEKVFI